MRLRPPFIICHSFCFAFRFAFGPRYITCYSPLIRQVNSAFITELRLKPETISRCAVVSNGLYVSMLLTGNTLTPEHRSSCDYGTEPHHRLLTFSLEDGQLKHDELVKFQGSSLESLSGAGIDSEYLCAAYRSHDNALWLGIPPPTASSTTPPGTEAMHTGT